MENSEIKTTDIEKKESENWFNKLMFKIMKFFGFTSGVGIVAVGAYWFLFSIIQYISLSPANVMQQVIHENHFNQAQTGIVIVALGILIRAVKEQK